MTRVEFFFNLENKLEKLVELVDVAYRKNRQLLILTPSDKDSRQVSHQLWTAKPQSFLPHVVLPHSAVAETPIIITHEDDGLIKHDILINLCQQTAPFFSRYTRCIELVSKDEDDRAKARARFKFYRDRGYDIKSYDALGNGLS